MAIDTKYLSDVDTILSHRHDQGADFWTTPDRRLFKGTPYSALSSASMLLELGMEPSDPILEAVAALFFDGWKEDGRFKVYPTGGILPCQSAHVAELLCRMGYASDARLVRTFEHFLQTPYEDGGWRCNKFFFGRGPETEHSNPLPTLVILNAFRFSDTYRQEPALDRAVEFLLSHWTIRMPIGPCHYGIGTRFMQVEYPMGDYNLLYYVYVLSHYAGAREDPRFLEALAALESKLVDGMIVPERVNRKLSDLSFCRKGAPSELATGHYRRIKANLGS